MTNVFDRGFKITSAFIILNKQGKTPWIFYGCHWLCSNIINGILYGNINGNCNGNGN